jgi:hypothetical protein
MIRDEDFPIGNLLFHKFLVAGSLRKAQPHLHIPLATGAPSALFPKSCWTRQAIDD